MRKVAASLVCLGFASSAWAGTVSFTPVAHNIDANTGGIASYEVRVQTSDMAQFDTVFMVIGSNAPFAMDFDYAQSFVDLTTVPPAPAAPFGIFAPDQDLALGGNRFATPAFTAPLLVGTLTFDVPAGSELASYDIYVSSQQETELLGFSLTALALGTNPPEGLEGRAVLNVVPEPATLALLGFGGLAAVMRRRIA